MKDYMFVWDVSGSLCEVVFKLDSYKVNSEIRMYVGLSTRAIRPVPKRGCCWRFCCMRIAYNYYIRLQTRYSETCMKRPTVGPQKSGL